MKPWEIQAAEVIGLALAAGALGGALLAWITRRR